MDNDDLVSCPICSLFCSQSEIEAHVALHFEDEPPAAAAAQQPQQQHQHAAVHIDDDDEDDEDGYLDDGDEQKVYCSAGCGALLSLHELDSHEEAHRLQEMEQRQFEMQQQDVDQEHQQLQMKFGFSDKRPGKCFRCGQAGHWSVECPSNPQRQQARPQERLPSMPAQLTTLQQPDAHAELHSVDVIPLLQACFEAQPKPHSVALLSGPVGFHSGSGQADSGWGCGFRNIQMQVSHQLMRGNADVRAALFGGCDFVPDVASLQAWLEAAWAAGFDAGGAAMFGGSVQCSRKWVGTTEAAALLRYLGCRAQLVEFLGHKAAHQVHIQHKQQQF
ncbi:hypothetical protein OEZ85_005018 [Tetradesmus obliquus]|uniref:CCHC-type domain-containing protein n=1 Tax=Tetradesmus obliquus TaxID=3088 RepID=A0ABY8UHB4_TETOB|nr:hypothetical protein OEZ85_005018 [Tetradesmus obliquus]